MKKLKSTCESTALTSKVRKKSSAFRSSQVGKLKAARNGGVALESRAEGTSSWSSQKESIEMASFAELSRQDAPKSGKETGITRFSANDLASRPPSRTDWAAVDALRDEDIALAVSTDPDAAPLGLDWSKAKVYFPKGKYAVSLRIDPDVMDFFRSTGKGFQTRMNAVLRAYMEHEMAKREKT